MKRALIVGGSIGAIVLMILISFPVVISAKKIMIGNQNNSISIEEKQYIDQNEICDSIFEKVTDEWFPGYYILCIIAYILFQILAGIIP